MRAGGRESGLLGRAYHVRRTWYHDWHKSHGEQWTTFRGVNPVAGQRSFNQSLDQSVYALFPGARYRSKYQVQCIWYALKRCCGEQRRGACIAVCRLDLAAAVELRPTAAGLRHLSTLRRKYHRR